MIDIELLRKFIARSGKSLTCIAKELDITYISLNNKLKGKFDFTLKEALALRSILDLTQQEWDAVFDDPR